MADKGVIMRCVIIAGSPDTNSDFLSEVIKPDDYVICADRGCNFAKQAGITPNLVVGDFDSEPDVLFPNCETVRLIPEKDDTDTMHSVDLALEKRFDEIAILGHWAVALTIALQMWRFSLIFTNTEVRAFSFLKKRK